MPRRQDTAGSAVRLEHERAHRIRTEEELRRNEASLAEAQRIARLGNWDWNIVDNELHWSDEIYRIFGLDPRKFGATYEAFLNSVHPDDRSSVQDAVDRALKDRAPYNIDHRIVRPDGTERTVCERAEVFLGDDGTPVRMVGTVQDITERVIAEQGLAQRQTALEAVYRIATTTGASMGTMCDEVAKSLSELLNVPHVVVRRYQDDRVELISWAAEDQLRHEGAVEVACGPCGKVSRENRIFQFSGDLHELFPNSMCLGEYGLKSYIGVPVRNTRGDGIGIVCAMDVREREFDRDEIRLLEIFSRYVGHEIEHSMMEAELHLSQRMKVLGQIASGVAHEVRNPLNAILAVSEALNQDLGESSEHGEYIEQIRTQVQRLSKLMQDLLDLGKPIRESSMRRESLPVLCSMAVDLWRRSTGHDDRTVRVDGVSAGDGPDVIADGAKLQQVFFNLIDNAAQHSPADEDIVLSVSGSDQNAVAVRVIDRGEGVGAADLDRVFDPFYTTRKGGTGLGLSIVKHIVETHGGRIGIANNDPPPGCTVEVVLPVAKEGQE